MGVPNPADLIDSEQVELGSFAEYSRYRGNRFKSDTYSLQIESRPEIYKTKTPEDGS